MGKHVENLGAGVPAHEVPAGKPPAAGMPGPEPADLQGNLSHRSSAVINRIAQLRQVLQSAECSPPAGPHQSRAVAGNVLIRTIDLVQELWPDNPTWAWPLQELLYAIKNLDRGVTSDLLKKRKPSGRAPMGVQDNLVRPVICAAMTRLVEDGMKREAASRLIHGKLEKAGFKFPARIRKAGGSGTMRRGTQIEKWRERVMEQEHSGSLEEKCYRDALTLVKNLPRDQAVRRLLDTIKSCHPSHFARRS